MTPVRGLGRHPVMVPVMQGWPAIAKLVLPAASAAHATVAGVVDGLQARDGGAGGLNALHLAVRSGSAPAVRLLLDWARSGGARWAVAAGGPRGISAMHLAALLQDHGEIAALLRGALPKLVCHANPWQYAPRDARYRSFRTALQQTC